MIEETNHFPGSLETPMKWAETVFLSNIISGGPEKFCLKEIGKTRAPGL